MAERGLSLSEEKTVITNVRDGFDFLGFNIRKYGKEILTKPTMKAEKRFMENIRKVIKGNKGCKQESLIRMLNAKIRGWGAYYQHGATRDSFHIIDHQIFLALWQWAKRRHSKKGNGGLKTAIGITSEETTGLLRLNLKNQTAKKINSHC